MEVNSAPVASPQTSTPTQGGNAPQQGSSNSSPGLSKGVPDGQTRAQQKSMGQNVPEGGEQAKPTAPPTLPEKPKTYDVKVNNRIVKMTEQEVILHASKSHAADTRFNEAAKMRDQHQKFMDSVKKNPIQALLDPELGLTKEQIRDQIETWYNQEFIETEKLSPDQKKNLELEAKVKKYEEEKAAFEKKKADEAEQETLSQEREYYQGQIIVAMEKSGLAKTEDNAKRMAFYMRQNLANGWDAPIEMIIQQVKNDQKAWGSNLTENSSVEQIIEVFGEGLVKKVNQHYLKQLRESRKNGGTPSFGKTSEPTQSPESGGKVSYADVTQNMRRMRELGDY